MSAGRRGKRAEDPLMPGTFTMDLLNGGGGITGKKGEISQQ